MTNSESYFLNNKLRLKYPAKRMPATFPDFIVKVGKHLVFVEYKECRSKSVSNPTSLLNALQKEFYVVIPFIIAWVDKSGKYRYFYKGRDKPLNEARDNLEKYCS